jgi:glycosyltransferase involved in cell wall biosynthesis
MVVTGSSVPKSASSRRILVAGGHERITGGLEIFIARARTCLGLEAHLYTETPGRGGFVRYLRALSHYIAALPSCDIVWLHYGSAFDLAYLVIARLLGKKVAVTVHMGHSWRPMRNAALRALCNRLLCLADIVFVLHDKHAEQLGFPSRLVRRCRVLPTFLPADLLAGEIPERTRDDALRLVHVARLSAEKGSFAFLDVCESLSRRGIVFEATIIGPADDEVRRALTSGIERRGLGVAMQGALAQPELVAFLKRQNVLVNLSLQDAYPLTIIEALLCGVAPVCCALPGTEELAADAPVISLVEGQDSEAAADRIMTIDWTAIADGARALRRKFDWETVSRRYRECFAGLDDKAPPLAAAQQVRAARP